MTNMKKTILMLLLAAMSTGAMAEWVKIYKFPDGDAVYASPSSINRVGDKATMQVLSDGKLLSVSYEPNGASFQSTSFVALMEYDCDQLTAREMRNVHYSGRMGKGALVFDSLKGKPEGYLSLPVSVGTTTWAGWEVACFKK